MTDCRHCTSWLYRRHKVSSCFASRAKTQPWRSLSPTRLQICHVESFSFFASGAKYTTAAATGGAARCSTNGCQPHQQNNRLLPPHKVFPIFRLGATKKLHHNVQHHKTNNKAMAGRQEVKCLGTTYNATANTVAQCHAAAWRALPLPMAPQQEASNATNATTICKTK